jgi:23S rRNA pseudouridine2605 synthase
MAKKSTKTTKTDDLQPPATETEAVVKPKVKAAAKVKAKPAIKAKTKKAAKPAKVVDPIGDETDGEAKTALEPAIATETEGEIEAAEDTALTEAEIEDGPYAGQDLDADEPETDTGKPKIKEPPADLPKVDEPQPDEPQIDEPDPEINPRPRPPAKLDRLQKILAQAGVASRRKAEELIEQGRVQVNGKVITELGTKADAGRDHIRVDGKLLQGAERHRYFVLNKPRGFVTTVKDPEGRPTVMQFFDKMRERLYPVGRLDYMSEGLLLVTNDGELANRLTRASAGVEKTYLVKVAGVPSEAELDILRNGVAIERGKPGSDRVRTSPARIRQVRQGDNPWYEVVLIEGRNRELRKMFEEVGHFVEKIRRVGYGPLVLDQEPGNLRELDPRELELLRKAADGTLRTPKSKELRRRNLADAELPTVAPRSSGARPARSFASKSFEERPAAGPKDYRPKRSFDQGSGGARPGARPNAGPARHGQPPARDFGPPRPAWEKPAWKREDRPARPPFERPSPPSESRPAAGKPYGDRSAPARTYGAKPDERRTFGAKPPAGRPFRDKPPAGRPYPERPAAGRSYGAKPDARGASPAKPAWKKPEAQQWPPYKRPPTGPQPTRPAAPRREPDEAMDLGPRKPSRLFIEPIEQSDRPGSDRPSATRPSAPYSRPDRPSSGRPGQGRSDTGRTGTGRPGTGRPNTGRSSSARPFRGGEGGLARPFTTSSGKPRAGGARPNNKPGAPAGRPSSSGWKPGKSATRPGGYNRPPAGSGSRPPSSSRPFAPREEGASDFRPTQARPYPNSAPRAERKAGPGWKPKPSFGGPPKPGFSSHSKPRPGGFSKSGFKGKSSGPKRTGKPGGKKRG